jgi:hypothetical protein
MNTLLMLALAQALVISTPGTTTLDRDYEHSETVIAITADDVVLDLAGYTVRCTAPVATGQCAGVRVFNRANVTVKNGAITKGHYGVFGFNVSGFTLESVDLSENAYVGATLTGLNNRIVGITCKRIKGYAIGIYAICVDGIGVNGVIEDSEFGELYRQNDGIGEGVAVIVSSDETNVRVRNSSMKNNRLQSGSIAVWFGDNATGGATGLTINNFENPIASYETIERADNIITYEATVPGVIDLATTTVAPGGRLDFDVTNVDPPGPMDWVALTPANGADNSYVDWWYLNGSKTAPSSGLATASLHFMMPSTPDTYNIRMYANNALFAKLATSATITVGTPATDEKFFRVCEGSPLVCYSGNLSLEVQIANRRP